MLNMLNIQENIMLEDFTTFHIGGPARYFVTVKDLKELKEAIFFTKREKIKFLVLGGGSNILMSDSGFDGLVIKNEIKKKEILPSGLVVFGSGENWDEAVEFAVSQNLVGFENLSGIPGTVGATPVQNVGAYGMEIKDTLFYVKALNTENGEEEIFKNEKCQFAYRSSIFKKLEYKKYILTEVAFALKKDGKLNTSYKDIKNYFADHSDIPVNLRNIRQAVLNIRNNKFPDIKKFGLAGSFFKNPVITNNKYQELILTYKDLPNFPAEEGFVKVPLAWILDHICKLKGYKVGNVGLYENQPIVLLNFGGVTAKEVLALSAYVKKIVLEKTGIVVEEEVEII
jgi:UDP-N-acetylmuramate dehydrogenase